MIAACKGYLRGRLTAAGMTDQRISDDAERPAEWPPAGAPFAELRTDPERLRRDGTRSARQADTPAAGQATVWYRLLHRTLPIHVRLYHVDEPKLDALVTAFLATLGRRFEDTGPQSQWIYVRPQRVLWEDREQPRDRRSAIVQIDFEGGLYTNETVATLQDPPGVQSPATEVS